MTTIPDSKNRRSILRLYEHYIVCSGQYDTL